MEMCCKKNKKIEDSEKKYTFILFLWHFFRKKLEKWHKHLLWIRGKDIIE